MKYEYSPLNRKSNIVVQELKDEVLIYDLDSNKAFCLNETSALIWELCDGKNTILEISENLSKKLKEIVSEEYVWLALNQLKKENLIEENEEIKEKYQGLSRREVIRKIGYGSMIALPIISSVTAPTAISAQSCFGRGEVPNALLPPPTTSVSGTSACRNYCIVSICCNGGGGTFNSTGGCTCVRTVCA